MNECNGTPTHNYSVFEQRLNNLAKQATLAKRSSVSSQTNWLWVRFPLQSHKFHTSDKEFLEIQTITGCRIPLNIYMRHDKKTETGSQFMKAHPPAIHPSS